MNDRYGILVADDGTSIQDKDYKYDSREQTLILDLERDPKHMQIIQTSGGTNLPTGVVGDNSEVIYTFDHNLGYTPLVDAYFYAETYGGSYTHMNTGGYGKDFYFLSGSNNWVLDYLTFKVNNKSFSIIHRTIVYATHTGYVSTAASYGIKTKAYIYSIPVDKAEYYGYLPD